MVIFKSKLKKFEEILKKRLCGKGLYPNEQFHGKVDMRA